MASRLSSLKALTSRATERDDDADLTPFGGDGADYGDESSFGTSAGVSAMPMLPSAQKAMTHYEHPPLTSTQAASVRFNIAQPQGYHFPQVEEYVKSIESALKWHEDAAYAYRKAVTEQQVEIDNLTSDTTRLRTEIEVFKVQGSPLTNADGSYLTDSQAAAARVAEERLAQQEAELEAATRRVAELDTELARARAYLSNPEEADALREQLAAALARTEQLEAWAAQVQPIVTATEERALAAEARAEAAEAALTDAQEQVAAYAAAEAGYLAEIERLSALVGADVTVPAQVADEVEDGWEVEQPAPAVMPVESELPPGVALPQREVPEQYAPVSPGDPLRSLAGVDPAQMAPEVYGAPEQDRTA